MVRQQKKLVPTEKGLALHSVVKNMAIANVEMTGKWEAELAKIERDEASADGFTHSIEGYTREITAELLGCDRLFSHKDSGCQCPKCEMTLVITQIIMLLFTTALHVEVQGSKQI